MVSIIPVMGGLLCLEVTYDCINRPKGSGPNWFGPLSPGAKIVTIRGMPPIVNKIPSRISNVIANPLGTSPHIAQMAT